jgi:hypothetical protein
MSGEMARSHLHVLVALVGAPGNDNDNDSLDLDHPIVTAT